MKPISLFLKKTFANFQLFFFAKKTFFIGYPLQSVRMSYHHSNSPGKPIPMSASAMWKLLIMAGRKGNRIVMCMTQLKMARDAREIGATGSGVPPGGTLIMAGLNRFQHDRSSSGTGRGWLEEYRDRLCLSWDSTGLISPLMSMVGRFDSKTMLLFIIIIICLLFCIIIFIIIWGFYCSFVRHRSHTCIGQKHV